MFTVYNKDGQLHTDPRLGRKGTVRSCPTGLLALNLSVVCMQFLPSWSRWDQLIFVLFRIYSAVTGEVEYLFRELGVWENYPKIPKISAKWRWFVARTAESLPVGYINSSNDVIVSNQWRAYCSNGWRNWGEFPQAPGLPALSEERGTSVRSPLNVNLRLVQLGVNKSRDNDRYKVQLLKYFAPDEAFNLVMSNNTGSWTRQLFTPRNTRVSKAKLCSMSDLRLSLRPVLTRINRNYLTFNFKASCLINKKITG